jgi:hypothetical protein
MWLAILLPLGMIGFARRSRAMGKGILLMAALGFAAGVTGCSSGSTAKLPPAGPQVVTLSGTATGSAVVSSLQISVTVTN